MSLKFKTSTLTEVCDEIIDCVNKTAPVVEYETPFKMIRTTNVKKGYVDVDSVRYVTKETFDKWTRRTKPKRNDIILTREAPLGEVGLLRSDDNIFLGQRLIQYRANEEVVNQLYLYYAFQDSFVQGQIMSYGSGATVEHLRINDCETIKVRYPNLNTQKKVASILSAYDDIIENNNQRIKLIEEMAEEIYKEWFIRMRFPGYENIKFYNKEENEVPFDTVGALPKGWEKKPINYFVNIISGYAFKTEVFDSEGIYKLVTIKNVQDGFFVTQTTDYINELPKNLKENCKLKDKDIIISLTGNIGRICLVYGENYILNQRVAKLKPKDENYFEFVYLFFRSSFLRSTLENLSNGAAQQNLSPIEMGKLEFPIPSNKIMTQFSELTKSFFDEIIILLKKNQILQETRDLLLPRLISGKLNVEDLEIENSNNINIK